MAPRAPLCRRAPLLLLLSLSTFHAVADCTLAAAAVAAGGCVADAVHSDDSSACYDDVSLIQSSNLRGSFPIEAADDSLAATTLDLVPCNDTHPFASSPNMLNFVWSTDLSQAEGLQASMASVIKSTVDPSMLTMHILTQRSWFATFQENLGIRPQCQGTFLANGALLLLHPLDSPELLLRNTPPLEREARAPLNALENFARFYMHLVLKSEPVVIYLDTDTIVQADLSPMAQQLRESGKTAGFVSRESPAPFYATVHRPPANCTVDFYGATWDELANKTTYNVGVMLINLKRWREQRMLERLVKIMQQHEQCGTEYWVGGSQPPLLLAFLAHPEGQPDDFIAYDANWVAGNLGWGPRRNMTVLMQRPVLHWTGPAKPWLPVSLYPELWAAHRSSFNQLVMSTEEFAAQEGCPNVRLLDDWSGKKFGRSCRMGRTFGCQAGMGEQQVWTSNNCSGLFSVSGSATVCGLHEDKRQCSAGAVPEAEQKCGLMIITTYFTTKRDWQRGKLAEASYSKIRELYRTAVSQGLNVTVVYDKLPEEIIRQYSSDRFHFQHVDLADYDSTLGVNDIRYFIFRKLMLDHPEWNTVFTVDAFDVRVPSNPCGGVQEGKLYVGSEQVPLLGNNWMRWAFRKLGGRYMTWFLRGVTRNMHILNCGITGGRRDVLLQLFNRMTSVLSDPMLTVRRQKGEVNANMAALNYIVYSQFRYRFVTGAPLHSLYKQYQNDRKDVWFVHK